MCLYMSIFVSVRLSEFVHKNIPQYVNLHEFVFSSAMEYVSQYVPVCLWCLL